MWKQEGGEDLSPEEYKAQLEATKKDYSNSQQEAQVLNEALQVANNPDYLLQLHSKDPSIAEKVAQKQYNLSYEEARKVISGEDEWENKSDADRLKEEIKNELLLDSMKQRSEEFVKEFYKDENIHLDENFAADFKKTYDDLMEGKSPTIENTQRILKIALRETRENSKHLKDYVAAKEKAWVASAWSTRRSWNLAGTSKKQAYVPMMERRKKE